VNASAALDKSFVAGHPWPPVQLQDLRPQCEPGKRGVCWWRRASKVVEDLGRRGYVPVRFEGFRGLGAAAWSLSWQGLEELEGDLPKSAAWARSCHTPSPGIGRNPRKTSCPVLLYELPSKGRASGSKPAARSTPARRRERTAPSGAGRGGPRRRRSRHEARTPCPSRKPRGSTRALSATPGSATRDHSHRSRRSRYPTRRSPKRSPAGTSRPAPGGVLEGCGDGAREIGARRHVAPRVVHDDDGKGQPDHHRR